MHQPTLILNDEFMASPFKSMKLLSFVILSLFALSSCNEPKPQEPNAVRRKSPIAIANITHQESDTYLKIVYGQPYKRGRQVFGNIVPYGKTWRTGANEATEFTATGDILFGGKELDAGTYTLFTVPRRDSTWTVILNNELGQWGDFEYNPADNVLRIQVPSMKTQAVTEAFTIHFSEIIGDSTNIVMSWDQTKVKVPVKFVE